MQFLYFNGMALLCLIGIRLKFYSMFFTDPVGRHKVNICTNISCWLNGAEDLLAHAEKKLGLTLGETTEDGRISLIREE